MRFQLVSFCVGTLIFSLSVCGIPDNDDPVCTPGSRWKKECNWCSCGLNGDALCTKKGCIGIPDTDGPVCTPGSSWKNDCNWCNCGETGLALCTRKGCIERLQKRTMDEDDSEVSRCTPGTTWREEESCNWCKCLQDGTVACTRRACLPPIPGLA